MARSKHPRGYLQRGPVMCDNVQTAGAYRDYILDSALGAHGMDAVRFVHPRKGAMAFTSGSYPPFGNPSIAEFATQITNSLGITNGLSQYLNQGLGEAISANAEIIYSTPGLGTYVLAAQDHAAICYTTASALAVQLPFIGGVGRMVEVIKASSDANQITVTLPPGVTFVDGTTTFILYNQNDYVDIISNPTSSAWSIRGYRQRGLPNNGGFSGLAGAAQATMGTNQASQTITSPTPVVFPVITFDNGLPNRYFTTASPTKFVVPAAGIYLVQAQVPTQATLTSTGPALINIAVRVNGGTYAISGQQQCFTNSTAAATTINSVVFVSGLVSLTSGSYVEAVLLNNYIASLQTVTTGGGSIGVYGQFSILQVG